jgi:NAD(P)-dependent dehydrogenase (short-subunit alcohol dehydrogenase family)
MDFSSVQGKVAIVTGASSGIGKAIAMCYAEHGMKVVCSNRDPIKGKEVVDAINAMGGNAVFFQSDISNVDEVKALIDYAMDTYGQLDGIVNNAGIGMGGSPLHEFSIDDFEKIMSLNLKGVFAAMKYGSEAIFKSKSKSGFIINVSSIAGLMPQSGQSLYTATKFGVVGMTKSASIEYAPYNLTVNAICPGYTMTSIFGDAPEATMKYFTSNCPSGRMGEPEECAYLALFLASDMARYISGAAIPVDGALSAGSKNVMQWKHPEILE